MRSAAILIALVILLAVPATAGAVADLRIVEHAVPATASTGEVVQARVTVMNVGDTPTEGNTEMNWKVTNGEGSSSSDFVYRSPQCPPGSDPQYLGPGGLCLISTPIAPGASITAVFSGSGRRAGSLESRVNVHWGTGIGGYEGDTKPLSITGPTLPEPPGPRVSRLSLADSILYPGERARLRFTLDRFAQFVAVALSRCLGRTGCRRSQLVRGIFWRGRRRGPNTLSFPLPAGLASGRYRITVFAQEPFHQEFPRSVALSVVPRRR